MKKALKKLDNKGFTLVELIIVIAIIAVLAAVIAPQYIKYVEKSRYSTDLNALNEIAHAAEVADVGDGTTQPSDHALTVDISGASDYGACADSTLAAAVNAICPEGKYTFKSKAFTTAAADPTITITNGAAVITNIPAATT